jgi:hypothetical protein
MARLSCPYCYRRIDGRNLWFRCTGRGSPGRPRCVPRPDPLRRELTGFDEASLTVFPPPRRTRLVRARLAGCPSCGAETGIRVCPECHTPLPAHFGRSRSPLIAMVGAKGTGKTVYLTVLAHLLLHGLPRRFDADVRRGEPTVAAHGDPMTSSIDDLFRDGRLAAQTSPARDGRRLPWVVEWRTLRTVFGSVRRLRSSFISFYDTAGEDLNSSSSAYGLAYLAAADATIVLLDPFMIPQMAEQIRLPSSAFISTTPAVDVLGRVTEALRSAQGVRSGALIRTPVAVAFCKIDAFFGLLGADHPLLRTPAAGGAYDDTEGVNTHEQVRALLHSVGADAIDRLLAYNYSTYRYFVVSSLGAEPDYEAATVDPAGVRPFRVEEPLVWLLSRFGVIPVTKRRP